MNFQIWWFIAKVIMVRISHKKIPVIELLNILDKRILMSRRSAKYQFEDFLQNSQ